MGLRGEWGWKRRRKRKDETREGCEGWKCWKGKKKKKKNEVAVKVDEGRCTGGGVTALHLLTRYNGSSYIGIY